MNQAVRLGLIGLTAVALAGGIALAPATINPPATTAPEQALAQAPTIEPIPPTATVAPPTALPVTEPPPTSSPPTATARPEPTPEPTAALANAELGYRAHTEGRPAPPPPPADGSLLTVSRGPSERLEVALTFDAGADRGYAAEILDLLRDYGIKATFGMTGIWAEKNPDLILRMVNEGHQIINHTYDHPSFTGASTGAEPQSYESILFQLNQTEQIVWEIAGYEMKPYARPPYGDIGPMTSGFLVDAGYYINVLWSCDSQGWRGLDAAQVLALCTTNIGPGEIVLLHVGADAPGDVAAVPGMIEAFGQAGYRFVTIEQMLQP